MIAALLAKNFLAINASRTAFIMSSAALLFLSLKEREHGQDRGSESGSDEGKEAEEVVATLLMQHLLAQPELAASTTALVVTLNQGCLLIS